MFYLCLIDFCFILILFSTIDGKRCPKPEHLSHATVSTSNTSFDPGTIIVYTCDNGYYLKGPSKKLCNPNGSWIPMMVPKCDNRIQLNNVNLTFQNSNIKNKAGREIENLNTFTFFNTLNRAFIEESSKPPSSSKGSKKLLMSSNYKNSNSSFVSFNEHDLNSVINHQFQDEPVISFIDHNNSFDLKNKNNQIFESTLLSSLNVTKSKDNHLSHSILLTRKNNTTPNPSSSKPYNFNFSSQIDEAFYNPSHLNFPLSTQPNYLSSQHQAYNITIPYSSSYHLTIPTPIQQNYLTYKRPTISTPIKYTYLSLKQSNYSSPVLESISFSNHQTFTSPNYPSYLHSINRNYTHSNHLNNLLSMFQSSNPILSSSSSSKPFLTQISNNHRHSNYSGSLYKPYMNKMKPSSTTPASNLFDDEPILLRNNHKKKFVNVLSPQYIHYLTSSFLSTTTPYPTSSVSIIPTFTLSSSFSSTKVNTTKHFPQVSHLFSNSQKKPDKIFSQSLTVLDPQPSFSGLNTTVFKNLLLPSKWNTHKPTSDFFATSPHNINKNISFTNTNRNSIKPNKPALVIIGDNKPLYHNRPIQAVPLHQQSASFLNSTFIKITTLNTSEPPDYKMHYVTTSTTIPTTIPTTLPQNLTSTVVYHLNNPNTPSEGFVHAIYAPPMPTHPTVNYPSSTGNAFLDLMGVDSFSKLLERYSLFKTVLFTVLVMFAPPLALAAAISQLS